MNRRDLKRSVHHVCSELFAECIAVALYKNQATNADELLNSIVTLHDDFVKRISHVEPGMKPKKYFDVLWTDFEQRVTEVIDQINAL